MKRIIPFAIAAVMFASAGSDTATAAGELAQHLLQLGFHLHELLLQGAEVRRLALLLLEARAQLGLAPLQRFQLVAPAADEQVPGQAQDANRYGHQIWTRRLDPGECSGHPRDTGDRGQERRNTAKRRSERSNHTGARCR